MNTQKKEPLINNSDVERLQNYLIMNGEMIRILCSICNCPHARKYIGILDSLAYLDNEKKDQIETFNNLIKKLNKVPSYKVLLYELGVKEFPKDEEKEYEYKLYDENELDDIFILLQRKNIQQAIINCTKQFIKGLENEIFDETILDTMCNYNMDLHKRQSISDCYDELPSIYDNYVERKPISTGISELDRNDITFAKGELTSIAGATGSFKTTLMTNIAYNKIKENMNVAYLSLEISKKDMYFNILSLHSTDSKFKHNIPHTELKRSLLEPEQKEYFFKTVYEDFKNMKQHLIIVDEKDIGLNSFSNYSKLLANIDRKFERETGTGIDILIVDHLQMLKNNTDLVAENSYIVISKWVDYFRRNSKDFLGFGKSIATFVVSQVNRKGIEESNKNYGKYTLSAFADSAEIERQSTNAFAIRADTTAYTNNVTFQIMKYRNDECNNKQINIHINPKYYCFNVTNYKSEKVGNYKLNKNNDENQEFILNDYFKLKESVEADYDDYPILSFDKIEGGDL